MRASKHNAGSSGLGGRLSSEFARILDRCDWRSGDLSKGHPLVRHRALHIEPLEVRHLLSAVNWFEVVANDETEHAGAASWTADNTIVSSTSDAVATASSSVYDWIVQFDTNYLGSVSSVADTISLVMGHGIEFDVIEGLGLTGVVLVRSSGASLPEVKSCFESIVAVACYEQDAYHETNTGTSSTTTSSYALDAIDADDAWAITAGSTSVVTAVIDTGVDYSHVALSDNIWVNPGEIAGNKIDDDGNGFVDDVYGYDFANDDSDPMDDNGHGTHVTGIITSVSNCSIMALKFLNSDGSGYLSDAIQAVNYATMMRSKYGVNVRVDNNSWGGSSFSSALQASIEAANSAGILFVVAAGNEGSNNDTTVAYPANYTSANVISVAASTQAGALASFSNYGVTTVDIAAPGVSILSTTLENTYSYMSGTSMATPYVSAVAALAWSVYTDATVAQVKSALISGAEDFSALKSKVAAGGVVNALNTLNLLAGMAVSKPVISTLTPSANSVMAGSTVTLTASGITDAAGTIRNVNFYRDSNGNGRYDSNDLQVGSTSTVSNGNAVVKLSTTGFSKGSYRYFAVAVDSNNVNSAAVATTFAVLSSDDHGNNASSATLVGASSSTAGNLAVAGDKDWFSFTAVAGKTYVFTVQLGTLSDSVLYLYNRTGTAVLASNDDYGSSSASKITWTATTDGTCYLAVAGYGNVTKGTYTLKVGTENHTPVLATIANQAMSGSKTSLSVKLNAGDADGDALTYSATVMAVDAVKQKAYDLDKSLGLYRRSGGYYTNLHGAKEKNLLGKNNTSYYILPSGALYQWRGSIAKSKLVANLGKAYYTNPALLYNAPIATMSSVESSKVGLSFSGNTLTVTRNGGYTNSFYVQVTVSDGAAVATKSFYVSLSSASSTTAGNKAAKSKAIDSDTIPTETTSRFSGVSLDDAVTRLALESGNTLRTTMLSSFDTLTVTGLSSASAAVTRNAVFADYAAGRRSSSQSRFSTVSNDRANGRTADYVFSARWSSAAGTLRNAGSSNIGSLSMASIEPIGHGNVLASCAVETKAVDRVFDNLFDLLSEIE